MGKYSIMTFLKNIKYLFTYSLRDKERDMLYSALSRVEDIYRYEIMDTVNLPETVPNVLNPEQTLELLLDKPRSFVRFGDGEINIMNGKSIPFQKYNEELANIFYEILKSDIDELYVGINYSYFHSSKFMNEFNRKFYLIDAKEYRDFLIKHCNLKRTYIAAGFNQMYICSEDLNIDIYYRNIKNMFRNKEIIIFSGKGVLENLKYDVFEMAASREYVSGPALNAYDKYDELYEKALSYSKTKILCFILGPASKALVYRLTKAGYTAWDIGHMAKDYDYYCKKINKTDRAMEEFFSPD